MVDEGKREPAAVNPALASACAKNLPLDLRIEGDVPPVLYRSRFLGIDKHSEEGALLIEAPMLKGRIAPIRPGLKAKITFTLNEQLNYFETTVLDRGRYQLNPQVSVPSLELRMPEDVNTGQTRAFYRITIDDPHVFEVKVAILADDEAGTDRIRWRERATITDIGGGGLGFRIAEGKSLLIKVGTRLLLKFRLRTDREELELRGQVCFSLRQPELREAFFGVQFIEVESDIKYKQNVDRILHFVAEQQRRRLGERVGLSE